MRADLVSEQDDVEFELFAVRQGVAPESQESLQLRSDAVGARIRTIDSMLESRARAHSRAVPSVSSMSRKQIDAEFETLMGSIGLL
ncbi:MAG: hypothetical protein ACRDHN_15895 [Thermomicrobiales bacterium]